MGDLPTAVLGRTGLEVTKLGYGAMELRGSAGGYGRKVDDTTAVEVLNAVLDAGINFIDTSPDYGRSEELIGTAVAHRRNEYFLASKCGCQVDPPPQPGQFQHDFTWRNIRAGVEQSLRRMKTDYLDLVQFHMSPSPATLEEDDAMAELQSLQGEGKVRYIGVSGTLPELPDQIAMGVFDAFQIPYSAVEREHESAISEAAASGAGTIVRGGVARGLPDLPPDGFERVPEPMRSRIRQATEDRRTRWEGAELADVLGDLSPMEFMLRFTMSHPDMHTTIVGTASVEHLADNVAAARRGPLPPDLYERAKERLGAAPTRR